MLHLFFVAIFVSDYFTKFSAQSFLLRQLRKQFASKFLLTRSILDAVGFLGRFGLKLGIDFAHFGLESGMVFEGTTGVYERN